MEKEELRKNRLDIEYKSLSQKANIYLSFGTVTLIGFLSYALVKEQYLLASLVGLFITIFSYTKFKQTQNKMQKILDKIESLGNQPQQ